MSIDKSLVSKGKLVRHRNVLTRTERIKHLADDGLWDEKKSVYGLPKVKTAKVKKKAKVAKKTEEEASVTATASAPASATTGAREKGKSS